MLLQLNKYIFNKIHILILYKYIENNGNSNFIVHFIEL